MLVIYISCTLYIMLVIYISCTLFIYHEKEIILIQTVPNMLLYYYHSDQIIQKTCPCIH